MADFNYVKSQNTADKLIAKFGGKKKGLIIRAGTPTGTPTRPIPGVPVEIPATLVAVDYTVKERQALNVQEGAKRILVSPLGLPAGFDLMISDILQTADGEQYTIVPPIGKFKPTTLVLFYDCQATK